MRILLVNPKFQHSYRASSLPLGLLSIATYLNKNNHEVKIFDRTAEGGNINRVINEFSPDMVGLSLYAMYTYSDALHVSKAAKKKDIPVIWGGVLVTSLPEVTLSYACVDFVCMGEGEQTMLEIAQSFDLGQSFENIPGLAYKKGGEVQYTAQRDFIDLAILPPLDFSLINPEKYFIAHLNCEKMLYLYTSKGCHFNCTFCYNEDFHRSTYRKRPLGHLEHEINYLVKNHGLDGIYFSDELFCGNKNELSEICELLTKFNVAWGAQTALSLFNENDFQLMYAAGCRWLCFGIESGSENMQKKMRKNINLPKAAELVAACERAGIAAITNFIIGLPDESEDDLAQTVSFILSLPNSLFNVIIYALSPGSEDSKRLISKNKQAPVESFKALCASKPTEKVVENINSVKARDLYVIRACFMLRTFFANKGTGRNSKAPFMAKVIKDALVSLKGVGPLGFIYEVFYYAQVLLGALFYANFFPKVRRKYGMTKNNGFSIFGL